MISSVCFVSSLSPFYLFILWFFFLSSSFSLFLLPVSLTRPLSTLPRAFPFHFISIFLFSCMFLLLSPFPSLFLFFITLSLSCPLSFLPFPNCPLPPSSRYILLTFSIHNSSLFSSLSTFVFLILFLTSDFLFHFNLSISFSFNTLF